MFFRHVCLTLTVLFGVSFAQEPDSNRTMTYIKYRLEGPGLTEVTRKSKELWRVGSFEMRSLEPADTSRKIQPLTIFNPPDVWLINLYDSSGRHTTQQSELDNSYAPILSFMRDEPFMHFQFGQEMDFLTALKVEPTVKRVSDSVLLDIYNFDLMNVNVTVNVNQATGNPLSIVAVLDTTTYKIIYEEYQTGLELDSSLFMPPDLNRISEVR